MIETFTVPVYCVHCGRAVMLLCRESGQDEPRQQFWSCPYSDCRRDVVNAVPGTTWQIVDERPGHLTSGGDIT